MAWHNRYKQHSACKQSIDKELMLEVWHPAKAQNGCMSKDEKKQKKKEVESFSIDEKKYKKLAAAFYNFL